MKILITDDSPSFRTFMLTCLKGVDDIQVVGVAGDGQTALQMIADLQPDLVTLDMDMPKLNGLQVLERMRNAHAHIKVIMVACSTETDADKTMQALALGAFDFIIKPDVKVKEPKVYLKKRLLPKIKVARSLRSVLGVTAKPAMTTVKDVGSAATSKKAKAHQPSLNQPKVNKHDKIFTPDVIAIGSSTGGPAALQEVLGKLPASFTIPIVVTQHMPKAFLTSLAMRLQQQTQLDCKVAEQGEVLKAGHIYMAAGDTHMKIIKENNRLTVCLEGEERVNHAIPSVDVTFESLAALSPHIKTLAVILTGMGYDGAKGAKTLKNTGNYVVVQDETSSVVWGMAGEAFRLDATHEVLPLNNIAQVLMQYGQCHA